MRTIRDVSSDPQAIANGYVRPVTFPDDLTVMMPCPPVQFSEYEMRDYTPAGHIGTDTEAVFRSLGYTDDQIAEMRADGAIR